MGWIGDILSLGGAAITGGLTGILGMGVKALFGWLGAREERETLKVKQAHEVRLLELQQAARAAETENERAIASEATRQASYDFANVSGQSVWKWAASVVTLMRPAITLYLLLVTTWLMWMLLYGGSLPYVDTPGLIKEVVTQIVYLTSTAVTWWWGDRPPQTRR